ncbi:hypothetical protein Vafri_14841 [Volvox africanus]|uniref:Uncharacterized protein n=1 Tax=Volvox africanus TaxID=51714 RepID=A0A8J4BGR0_9CHLO|nr:hypothetical protein Vafri_14841 [Volvox africanus]
MLHMLTHLMSMRGDNALVSAAVPLLLFMACWVLIFPASYRVGWWPSDVVLMERLVSQPFLATPADVVIKYAQHPAVKLTHLLPSGVWSICGAIQLIPQIRSSVPRLHRISGQVMFLCSILIVIGYALMEASGLVTTLQPSGTTPPGPTIQMHLPHFTFRLLSAWFLLTAGVALAHARRGEYKAHRRWAVRHIASGAWVIVQRVFVMWLAAWAAMWHVTFSEVQRHQLFYGMSALAAAVCLIGAELHLQLGIGSSIPGGPGYSTLRFRTNGIRLMSNAGDKND